MKKQILVCSRCKALVVDPSLKTKWINDKSLMDSYDVYIRINDDHIDLCPVCTRAFLSFIYSTKNT